MEIASCWGTGIPAGDVAGLRPFPLCSAGRHEMSAKGAATLKYCPSCATELVTQFVHGRSRPTCPECGLVQYLGPKVAVGCIIALDGKLIFTRRTIEPGRGRWTFPSGYVDLGEDVAMAAVREAKEETGMDVQLDRLVGVYGNPEQSVVFVVYAGSVLRGELSAGDEADAIGLFSENELPELAFEHDYEILAEWAKGQPSTHKGRDVQPAT